MVAVPEGDHIGAKERSLPQHIGDVQSDEMRSVSGDAVLARVLPPAGFGVPMKANSRDRTLALKKLLAAPSSALFSGPNGSGKLLAAQEIATALGVELRRVDLAKLTSRYLGETEKNIDALFDAAERDGAVLFFDEADALFGKRTKVRDAHDRYANIEVSYLLARIEAHSGVTIIATSRRENIDPAFLRRLRIAISF